MATRNLPTEIASKVDTTDARLLGRRSILAGATAVNMRPWRDAMVRVQRGTGFARVLCVGTSSTYGVGPTSENYQWVRVFAETMRARTGFGEYAGDLLTSQTKGRSYITAGTGWTDDPGGSVGNIGNLQGAVSAEGELTFTHPHCDRFTLWYTTGNFTLQIDSESAVTGVTGAGSTINAHTIVSGNGVGEHTLILKDPISATARPYAVEAHVGTTGLRVMNLGVTGAVSDDFDNSNNYYSGLPLIDKLNPDLVILQIGGNDQAQDVEVASFKSRLKTVADYVWDNTPATIVLIEPIEEHGSEDDLTYGEAVREIADEVGVMTFSVTDALLGDPNAAIYSDGGSHFNNTAHTLWGRSMALALAEC